MGNSGWAAIDYTAVFALVSYIAGLFIARWHWIIKPNKEHLDTQIQEVSVRLSLDQVNPLKEDKQEKIVIEHIGRILQEARKTIKSNSWSDYIFGNTQDQLKGWRLVHEAERLSVDIYSPEVIRSRSATVKERLLWIGSKEARALAEEIGHQKEDKALRAFLKEALGVVSEERDTYFERLAGWHNKAMWLIFTALVIILSLSFSLGNMTLFLVGAIGGLLGKLRGAVGKENAPVDYGASWTTLFLTPMIGALTGWSGILLVLLLIKVGVLGEFFIKIGVVWKTAASQPETLGLAIIFGYSASLFEKLIGRFEGKMEDKEKDKSNKK